ncbi:hypothetical protein EDD72_1055 [Tepidibacillus fermentans]|uniref:Uncharacterized protein n=1 Tax=Tepidibacillus fermentans TaxID=1281767 RepID=A0A4R3KIW6_9BACI|nr:hypothetical protein EDD72_1055 [Tepidibacillus fermentans]
MKIIEVEDYKALAKKASECDYYCRRKSNVCH